MPSETSEVDRSIARAISEFRQTPAVLKQYRKLILNLIEGNFDEKDIVRMIETLEVEPTEEGGK